MVCCGAWGISSNEIIPINEALSVVLSQHYQSTTAVQMMFRCHKIIYNFVIIPLYFMTNIQTVQTNNTVKCV